MNDGPTPADAADVPVFVSVAALAVELHMTPQRVQDVVYDLRRPPESGRQAMMDDDGSPVGQRIEADRQLFTGWSRQPDDLVDW